MSIDKTRGGFETSEDGGRPLSEFEVKFLPLDLVAHWRRCGMTADFLAYFISYAFRQPENALSTLSTVINELLENAVKFSVDKREPVSLGLSHFGETIRIETRNICSEATASRFDAFLERLMTEDIEDLFIAQIEHNAESARSESGLGLITMKKDYGADIGVRIRPVEGDAHEVVVQVRLNAEEVDKA